jgi:hypothetical protein
MKKLSSGPALPPKPPRIALPKDILWGCQSGGSPHFPRDLATIHQRRYAPDPEPMHAFRDAVMNAAERVWVVDEYFLVPNNGAEPDARVDSVLAWFPDSLAASDIRILTKEHKQITDDMLNRFEQRAQAINARNPNRPAKCLIQICTQLTHKFNFIHDRFAVIDDELWHFGASVGGFHSSVTAASRGWDAVDLGAVAFFEMAWDKCKER